MAKQLLARDVKDLLRPHVSKPEPLEAVTCVEAALAVRNMPDETARFSLRGQPVFRVRGQLAGPLGRFSSQVITIPLTSGSVRMTISGSCEAPGELVRATESNLEDVRRLVFVFGDQALRYDFELPEQLEVLDFQELRDERPVFRSLPPIPQMAAFLRATMGERRTPLRTLRDVIRTAGTKRAGEVCRTLTRLYPAGHPFHVPAAVRLHELLELEGRRVNRAVVAAFCLFVDAASGRLDAAAVAAAASQGRDPHVSAMAAFVVARFFCIDVPESEWNRWFPETFADCLEAFRKPPFPGLVARLRAATEMRDGPAILRDLAAVSQSRRAAARADEPFPVEPEHHALRSLLAEQGRHVSPVTLAALCRFVDLEVEANRSLYGLLAVAAAFDTPLQAFRLPAPPGDGGRKFLAACLRLSRGGALVFLEQPRHLATPEEVETALTAGLELNGPVLLQLEVLDQLSVRDLEALLEAGPVLGCFTVGGERLWCRLDQGTLADGNAFQGQAAGRLMPPGRGPGTLAADRDRRGNLTYRNLDQGPSALVVELPNLEGWPDQLGELGLDELLGRRPAPGHELADLVRSGLELLSEDGTVYVEPSRELRERLARRLEEEGPELSGLTDRRTLTGLGSWLRRPEPGLKLYRPLAEAPEGYAALEVLLALCLSPEIQLGGHRYNPVKQYDRRGLEMLVRRRRFELLDDPDPSVRATAARLLATSSALPERYDWLVVEYELSRLLEDPHPPVARAATASLARLALSKGTLPPAVTIGGTSVPELRFDGEVSAKALARAFRLPEQVARRLLWRR